MQLSDFAFGVPNAYKLTNMIAAFREAISSLLPTDEATLNAHLLTMTAKQWRPLAELFAARLPDFDAVLALPASAELARQVVQMRGVPLLIAEQTAGGWSLPGTAHGGEALLLTEHLLSGEAEAAVIEAAQAQGLTVPFVGVAIERTSLGGRARLAELGSQVRAVIQLADTPRGLGPERRTPDRWSTSLTG